MIQLRPDEARQTFSGPLGVHDKFPSVLQSVLDLRYASVHLSWAEGERGIGHCVEANAQLSEASRLAAGLPVKDVRTTNLLDQIALLQQSVSDSCGLGGCVLPILSA